VQEKLRKATKLGEQFPWSPDMGGQRTVVPSVSARLTVVDPDQLPLMTQALLEAPNSFARLRQGASLLGLGSRDTLVDQQAVFTFQRETRPQADRVAQYRFEREALLVERVVA
jgi:hypothetical protein